jgi:hypothetical protein
MREGIYKHRKVNKINNIDSRLVGLVRVEGAGNTMHIAQYLFRDLLYERK